MEYFSDCLMVGCLLQTVSQGIQSAVQWKWQIKGSLLLKGAPNYVQNCWKKKLCCLFQLPCVSVLGYRSGSAVLLGSVGLCF